MREFSIICIGVLCILSLQFCNETTHPDGSPLTGIWVETFTWIDLTDCKEVGQETHCPEYTQTTTLRIYGETFSATIVPPARESRWTGDSLWYGVEPDTLYTGGVSVKEDTMILTVTELDTSYWFQYAVEGDSLHCREIVASMQGAESFTLRSFLWGWAEQKSAGTFRRIE